MIPVEGWIKNLEKKHRKNLGLFGHLMGKRWALSIEVLCPKTSLTPAWLMAPNHSLDLLWAAFFRFKTQRTIRVW